MKTLRTANQRRTWRRIADSRLLNALAAPHGMGSYLEAVNPMWSLDKQRISARVTDIRHETPDAVTVEFKPSGEWTGFRAGQFSQVSIEFEGRQHTRCYSLSCAEGARRPTITVKAQADGFVSRYINERLTVGDLLTLSPAQGDFTLPNQTPDELLLIGGGSGITPLASIIETLLVQGHTGRISLLYYNESLTDTIFHRNLLRLADLHRNFSLYRAFSADDSGELQGLFNPNHLPAISTEGTDRHKADSLEANMPLTYVCGPERLMSAVSDYYEQNGQTRQLILERFGSSSSTVIDVEDGNGDVHFARSERYAGNDGRTLLEQAEAAGLRPQAGCRMGICHTCTCRKTAGAVRNIRTGEISVGDEQIRICVSLPVGDVTMEL